MFSKFTEEAQKILLMTKKEMMNLKHPYVGSEHLLLAILHNTDSDVCLFLNECGINYKKIYDEIVKVIGIGKSKNEWFLYTPLLKRIIEGSIENCSEESEITVEDLFVSLLDEGDGVANRILMGLSVDIDALYDKFSSKFFIKNYNGNKKMFIEEFAINYNKIFNTSGFDPVIGRDEQVNRLMEILLRRTKNNPLLIGDAGVGKTAIVEEFVRRIELGSVPKKLSGKKVYGLSMASLVAGTKYRGEFEERINQIIDELEDDDSIILFIDEIHTLVGAGGAEGAIDASNILKPYLARGKIRIIGATTKDEYMKFIESDKALDRRFQKINILEMSSDNTKDILIKLKPIYEKYHSVVVEDNIIDEIIRLCEKYVTFGKFPDKAIDLFDEVCAKTSLTDTVYEKKLKELDVSIKKYKDEKNKAIINHNYDLASVLKDKQLNCEKKRSLILQKEGTSNNIKKVLVDNLYEIVYEKTKIPVSHLKGLNKNKIIRLLQNKVIGQDNIVEKVVNSTIFNSNIRKNKPMVLLLVGKSGLGKTFLVKEYAKMLYSSDSFIKIDMSEYKDDFSSSKLIGAPPGYVGYKENNTLLDKIKLNPYSVLLLDEIEKASPSVLKLFLQVFDEGILTASNGDVVDFKNVTIFLTSNLSCNRESMGFSNLSTDYITESFKDYLGIEFLNRIDEVLIFNSLTKDDIKKIIFKQLTEYVEKNKINLKISPEIVNKLVEKVDFSVSGARKISRIVEKYVEENEILQL